MANTNIRTKKRLEATDLAVIGISAVGLVGVLVFGLPSPDDRPRVYEFYLAAFWGLIAVAHIGAYARWKPTPWPRRIFAVAAPLIGLLYLQKYFWS